MFSFYQYCFFIMLSIHQWDALLITIFYGIPMYCYNNNISSRYHNYYYHNYISSTPPRACSVYCARSCHRADRLYILKYCITVCRASTLFCVTLVVVAIFPATFYCQIWYNSVCIKNLNLSYIQNKIRTKIY